MMKTDIILGVFDTTGKVTVSDHFVTQMGVDIIPTLDTAMGGFDNIIYYSGIQQSGYTSITFERALVTNDTIADWPIIDGNMRVIWAHGDLGSSDPNTLAYHESYCGEAIINFLSGTSTVMDLNTLRYWHATLMISAFGVFMSFGIFVARYLKQYYWWFPLHIIVQVLAIVLAFSGFILSLIMTNDGHFSNIHSWFGLTVLALSFITPMMGWAADVLYNPSRDKAPIWPDRTHWYGGRLTIIIAYVTIILGMRQLQTSTVFQFGFGGLIVLYFGLVLYLEVYHWWHSREPKGHHTKLIETSHN